MISKKILKKGFFNILRIRRIEESLSKVYSNKKIRCPMHLSIGQEAIAVGVSLNLSSKDQVVSNHRCHAHFLAKGGNLNSMLSELYGKSNGCNGGRGGSMNLFDKKVNFISSLPIVGNTIALGVGLSLQRKIANQNNLTCIYLGEAATEEGIFYESLNFAKLNNLKCLFVIENNFFSVYTHLNQRRKDGINDIYNILKTKTFQTNGMSFLDVYNTTKEAKEYIIKKSQPALIIADTYRWLEHCGPSNDDNLNYRNKKELQYLIKKCPLLKIKKFVLSKNLLSKKMINHHENIINKEIINAFKYAEKSKFPKNKTSFNFTYA